MYMKIFLPIFTFSIAVTFAAQVFGQVGLEGISSGRYEVRKSVSRKPASSEEITVKAVKAPEKVLSSPPPASSETTEQKTVDSTEKKSTAVEVTENKAHIVSEPSISEQAQSLFSSKADNIYDYYREKIHGDDIRNNRLELDVLPVVAYNDSQSAYSYRDYQSYFNALLLKANVWFTPLLGVSGKVLFSLAADVGAIADHSRVPVKYEFMDLGVNIRKFFGLAAQDNSLEYSILYTEYKMATPNDNVSRARLKSSGLGLGLKGRFPTSTSYAWVLGGSLFPRLQHVESQTGIAISSGESLESVRIGFDLGGEWKFNRANQMIWNLNLITERNVFNGAANLPDPSNGQTPVNISVTNSLLMFSLGYRWGH